MSSHHLRIDLIVSVKLQVSCLLSQLDWNPKTLACGVRATLHTVNMANIGKRLWKVN